MFVQRQWKAEEQWHWEPASGSWVGVLFVTVWIGYCFGKLVLDWICLNWAEEHKTSEKAGRNLRKKRQFIETRTFNDIGPKMWVLYLYNHYCLFHVMFFCMLVFKYFQLFLFVCSLSLNDLFKFYVVVHDQKELWKINPLKHWKVVLEFYTLHTPSLLSFLIPFFLSLLLTPSVFPPPPHSPSEVWGAEIATHDSLYPNATTKLRTSPKRGCLNPKWGWFWKQGSSHPWGYKK